MLLIVWTERCNSKGIPSPPGANPKDSPKESFGPSERDPFGEGTKVHGTPLETPWEDALGIFCYHLLLLF